MTSKAQNIANHSSYKLASNSRPGAFLITRKDTIVIAMLVNIALLVVLFATASKKQESVSIQNPVEQVIHTEAFSRAVPEVPVQKTGHDEIDELLKHYVSVKSHENIAAADKPVPAKKQLMPTRTQSNALAEYYVLKSGDNPWTLARKFHIKFSDLLALNDLDEEKAKNLKVGQKIRIR
jgi:LysM repeat protein